MYIITHVYMQRLKLETQKPFHPLKCADDGSSTPILHNVLCLQQKLERLTWWVLTTPPFNVNLRFGKSRINEYTNSYLLHSKQKKVIWSSSQESQRNGYCPTNQDSLEWRYATICSRTQSLKYGFSCMYNEVLCWGRRWYSSNKLIWTNQQKICPPHTSTYQLSMKP